MNPAAHSGGIGQTRRIFAVRCRLLRRVAGTHSVTGLLSTAQAVVSRRHQPVGQNGEGLPAGPTNPTPHPDLFTPVVVSLTKSPSVANDGGISAKRTSPRQEIQWNYPGSLLSFGSGSAINRTTAGLQPPPLTVPANASISWPGCHSSGKVRFKRKNTALRRVERPYLSRHWPVKLGKPEVGFPRRLPIRHDRVVGPSLTQKNGQSGCSEISA